jgi:hypothetical protein
MAKPIRATPELRGMEARKFMERMERKEKSKITQKEIKLADSIMEFVLLHRKF